MKQLHGLVMETTKKHLILLTPDGDFMKVPHPGGIIRRGDKVACRLPAFNRTRAVAAAACLAAAMFALVVFNSLGGMPWGDDPSLDYLVFDINPSFELAYNKDLAVTVCRPLNREAVLLLEGWPEGEQLYDVLHWLLERSVSMGYINPDLENNLVMVTMVQAGLERVVFTDQLADFISEQLAGLGAFVAVGIFEVDAQTRETAEMAGISLNRYLIMESLHGQGKEDIPEDLPLSDLVRELDDDPPDNFKIKPIPEPEPEPDPGLPELEPGKKDPSNGEDEPELPDVPVDPAPGTDPKLPDWDGSNDDDDDDDNDYEDDDEDSLPEFPG